MSHILFFVAAFVLSLKYIMTNNNLLKMVAKFPNNLNINTDANKMFGNQLT